MQKSTHTNQSSIFLSTPSARRATLAELNALLDMDISIHALREEGDACRTERPAGHGYFYPRPPRGGRPLNADFGVVGHDFYPRPPRGGRLPGELSGHADAEFLSTPSARRATKKLVKAIAAIQFLSTPSARRATAAARTAAGTASHNFYPRPPRGGRQQRDNAADDVMRFLSTPSARRATPRA